VSDNDLRDYAFWLDYQWTIIATPRKWLIVLYPSVWIKAAEPVPWAESAVSSSPRSVGSSPLGSALRSAAALGRSIPAEERARDSYSASKDVFARYFP